MKIGLIQSRGIGDIIIGLPIAKYFVDQGHGVLWPIDEEFMSSFVNAAPYVEFLPIKQGVGPGGWFEIPLENLKRRGCERIIPLYNYLASRPDIPVPLLSGMKFDQYKYAVAGVPFREKWNLDIVRDREREERLFRAVVTKEDYVVCHLTASNAQAHLSIASIAQGRPIVEIKPIEHTVNRTENVFDWISVIERASLRVMINSCFANLTDQLRISGPKIYLPKPALEQTPVLAGDWDFLPPMPFTIQPTRQ